MSVHLDAEALSAYLDAELEEEDAVEVRTHLEACGECRRWLDELRDVERLVGTEQEPVPPEHGTDIATRVRARLLAERQGTRTLQGSWLAAAAALASVVVLPWVLLERTGDQEPPPEREAAPAAERPPASVAPPPTAAEGAIERVQPAEAGPAAIVTPGRREAPSRKAAGGAVVRSAPEAPLADETRTREEAKPEVPAPAPAASSAAGDGFAESPVQPMAEPEGDSTRTLGRAALQSASTTGRADPATAAFQELSTRAIDTAEDARRAREDWRAYARRHSGSRHAAAARMATVRVGAAAYRLGGRAEDLERLRADVQEVQRLGTATEAEAAQRALEEAQRDASP